MDGTQPDPEFLDYLDSLGDLPKDNNEKNQNHITDTSSTPITSQLSQVSHTTPASQTSQSSQVSIIGSPPKSTIKSPPKLTLKRYPTTPISPTTSSINNNNNNQTEPVSPIRSKSSSSIPSIQPPYTFKDIAQPVPNPPPLPKQQQIAQPIQPTSPPTKKLVLKLHPKTKPIQPSQPQPIIIQSLTVPTPYQPTSSSDPLIQQQIESRLAYQNHQKNQNPTGTGWISNTSTTKPDNNNSISKSMVYDNQSDINIFDQIDFLEPVSPSPKNIVKPSSLTITPTDNQKNFNKISPTKIAKVDNYKVFTHTSNSSNNSQDSTDDSQSDYAVINGDRFEISKLKCPQGYTSICSTFTVHQLSQIIFNNSSGSDGNQQWKPSLICWGVLYENDKTNFNDPKSNLTPTKRKREDLIGSQKPLAVLLWCIDKYQHIKRFYIEIFRDGGGSVSEKIEFLIRLLEAPTIKKISYNYQESLKPFLSHNKFINFHNNWDVKILSWILNPDVYINPPFISLMDITKHFELQPTNNPNHTKKKLEIKEFLEKEKEFSDEGSSNYSKITQEIIESYCVWSILEERASDQDMIYPFVSEMNLVPILSKMEMNGILLNTETMIPCKEHLEQHNSTLAEQAQNEYQLQNLNSPSQVLAALRSLGVPNTAKSADKKNLIRYKTTYHQNQKLVTLVNYILSYRKCIKLISTYINPYLERATLTSSKSNISDNLIFVRSNWLHSGTSTGRLSSQNPNLQNILKNIFEVSLDIEALGDGTQDDDIEDDDGMQNQVMNIRDCFQCREGNVLVGLDYNQIELRILSHFSRDQNLIGFFEQETDVIRLVACHWLNKPSPQDITDQERERTKRIVYGIVYGIGAKSLGAILKVSEQEAAIFKNQFLNKFPGIKSFIENTHADAKLHKFVKTLDGRVRLLPEINNVNDPRAQAQAKRQSVNTIIQGSASDLIKKAMKKINFLFSLINEERPELFQPQLVLQIHDELIFEIPQTLIDQGLHISIKNEMERVHDVIPLEVSMSIGTRWGSLVKIVNPTQDPYPFNLDFED
ncbi:DNA polymerase theta short isoform [Tieghemostelium lacteum]|uniref:DNA polymerase theta short isoform n=1 Tax=Tieghemostelium lacteum TaxID=361077 RepID=A0A151ZIR3_TIELA|nr:DNA polymerase theta short isoform [Tieghemostelium lacteum]|eukprot:KYQ93789.1 DNA polymerase theta short isoform [Tieghemostelium lacteum]